MQLPPSRGQHILIDMGINTLVCRALLPLFRWRLGTVAGLENIPHGQGYLLAANHVDFLDGFFISAALWDKTRPIKFLSKTKNYWWTFGSTIPVDADKRAASLDDAYDALKKGAVIAIFPEARRNGHGPLGNGRTGVARVALRSGTPIVPVGLRGPSGRNSLHSLLLYFVAGKRISIAVGKPLFYPLDSTQEYPKERLHGIMDEVMRHISELCGLEYSPTTP